MSSGATFDVTIVGAGPVGLTLAGLLGRLGHRVCVIERFASVYPLPRAVRFDGEAMRIFQGLGIVDEIEHDIVAADHYVWYGADGEVIIDFDLTEPAPSGWSSAYSFWQPTLDRALEGAATRQDTVTVMRGWQAQAVRQAADRVELELGQGTETAVCHRGGRRQLAAADGIEDRCTRSRLRRAVAGRRPPAPRYGAVDRTPGVGPVLRSAAANRQGQKRRLLPALGVHAPAR
jgi:2-polyprenyl-6-methoxyphenol hydroxylase-like FAD-dependent oxidoreductase